MEIPLYIVRDLQMIGFSLKGIFTERKTMKGLISLVETQIPLDTHWATNFLKSIVRIEIYSDIIYFKNFHNS